MVSSILASPNRECILWGEHRVMVYNDQVSFRGYNEVLYLLTSQFAVRRCRWLKAPRATWKTCSGGMGRNLGRFGACCSTSYGR